MKTLLTNRFRTTLTIGETDSKTAAYLLGIMGYLVVMGGVILFLN
jgi:hypothetical protein